jgi:hypothetical protein
VFHVTLKYIIIGINGTLMGELHELRWIQILEDLDFSW